MPRECQRMAFSSNYSITTLETSTPVPASFYTSGRMSQQQLDGLDERQDHSATYKARAAAMDHDWDGYGHHPKPALGALRNDRTPLNTPYTPQLVKLHLSRHDEYEQGEQRSDGNSFLSILRSKLVPLSVPAQCIRKLVDRVVTLVVPSFIQSTNVFVKYRPWVVLYCTTVLCVPIVLSLSPMLIAFCIFTSPIWSAGLFVLAVRALLPASHHDPIHVQSPAPRISGHHNGMPNCHPNAVYRRSPHLATNGDPYN